jgi:hypothetical protein
MVMMSGVTAAWTACDDLGVNVDRGATSVGDGSSVGREKPAASMLAGEWNAAGLKATEAKGWTEPAMAR